MDAKDKRYETGNSVAVYLCFLYVETRYQFILKSTYKVPTSNVIEPLSGGRIPVRMDGS